MQGALVENEPARSNVALMTRTSEGTVDVHTRAAESDSAGYPVQHPSSRAVTDGDHAGATNHVRAQWPRVSSARLGQSHLFAVCLLWPRNTGMARRSVAP